VLTLARRIVRPFRRCRLAPTRILFVKLAEQGSTVLAYDAIREAVARVGPEQVYFLVFEENRFILDLLGLVPRENVFAIRTQSASAMFFSLGRQLVGIWRARINTCIDLEFFVRSTAIISALTAARVRVGFHAYFGAGPYRGDLFTHRVLYNPHLHTAATFASLVHALDISPADLPNHPATVAAQSALPRFKPNAAERERITGRLARVGIEPDKRLILLNANCGDLLPQRKWSDGNYVLLARRLLREFRDARVLFTGSVEEAERIDVLVREVDAPGCVSVAGKTTLRELLVLYTLADVLVTNDSGPAHFAALTDMDVVALFGPETPLLFAVLGARSHPLWAKLPCSPCVSAYNNRQTSCRDNRCMAALTVDAVFGTVARIYRRRSDADDGASFNDREAPRFEAAALARD
jgi:ADP-heptose:LPS heptosyltransferase